MKAGGKEITFWEALQAFPPYYIRMLAKNGHSTALSDAEIAIASGIDINRVREIKCMTRWDDVTMGEVLRFTLACNFDPTRQKDRARAHNYERVCLKRNVMPYKYLRKSPKWESEILPVMRLLLERLRTAPKQSCAA